MTPEDLFVERLKALAPKPDRLRVKNERRPYYDWLYGGDLALEGERGVFHDIHDARFVGRDQGYVILRLNSGEQRLVNSQCFATVGAVSNPDHMNISLGKAGRSRCGDTRFMIQSITARTEYEIMKVMKARKKKSRMRYTMPMNAAQMASRFKTAGKGRSLMAGRPVWRASARHSLSTSA